MYSQAWSPVPSTMAVAPLLRTMNRSPTRPATNTCPPVAPYSTVLPASTASPASPAGRRPAGGPPPPPPEALAEVVVRLPHEVERHAVGEEGAEALPRRAREPGDDGPGREPFTPLESDRATE